MATALTLAALTGCDSTQEKNARAELVAKRQLGSRELPKVKRVNRAVEATRVSLVRGQRSTAIVVDLRSRSDRPLTDLPIEVGIRGADGRPTPLNARKNLDWFQTHVPAIAAGGRATWVFESRKAVPGGRPYARVGVPPRRPLSTAASLPEIAASAVPAPAKKPARVVVDNGSDVPQYGLQVYALVVERGRYVAAGKAAVEHVGTGKRATARVRLAGSPRRRGLRVHALPTIFE
jgi:hypothetical protein